MARKGFIGSASWIEAVPRHNAAGSLTFMLPFSHSRAADLLTEGARVHCTYHGVDGAGVPWVEPMPSGMVRLLRGEGPSRAGHFTFTVVDDWRLMERMLAGPNPAGTIAQQGDEAAYDTRTGTAEAVLKAYVTANAGRFTTGLPIVSATSLGRGATITGATMRMHTLADRLIPLIEQAGLGVTVRCQQVAGVWKLVVDVYVPATYPRTLTEVGGVIKAADFDRAAPTATKAVVMGGGEGTARVMRLVADSTQQTTWGDIIEIPVDARDTSDTAVLDQRGAEALAEGAATTGLRVELGEAGAFRYGGPAGIRVGDSVTLAVGPGFTVTDIIRETQLSFTPGEGLRVTPLAGGWDSDPLHALPKKLTVAFRAIRNLIVSR
jgi:hypothetical protein